MTTASIIPIGTIIPFCGDVTDTTVAEWLQTQGWLPCDGRTLVKKDYADLVFAIGTDFGGGGRNFLLPDLRGVFPRGTSNGVQPARDPGATSRTASGAGGNTGDAVGSAQAGATRLPVAGFTTNQQGDHTHQVPHAPVNNNAYAIAGSHYGLWNGGSVNANQAGAHSHTVNGGGDKETRPLNAYVNYIIKFNSVNN
ncbi:MAG TPA: phage tail protein [Longimicrobium sp.]|nr:phage tail protein [Longimicrobium sp.]